MKRLPMAIVGGSLAGVLVLAGCGSDSKSADSPATATTPSVTANDPISPAPTTGASETAPTSGTTISPKDFVWPANVSGWTPMGKASSAGQSTSRIYQNGSKVMTAKYDAVILGGTFEQQVEAAQFKSQQKIGSATCGVSAIGSGDAVFCLIPIGAGSLTVTNTTNPELAQAGALANGIANANVK